jgi:hypothetical protein
MSQALLLKPIHLNVLVQKLRTLIPELLELNGATSDRNASFHVLYQHEDSGILTF